ncbi:MAG: hypothetical protein KDD53_11835, partial [Bdellovibrionales bacterium]|nr:hypothetical protein [Bdellovibrionales bacterium]
KSGKVVVLISLTLLGCTMAPSRAHLYPGVGNRGIVAVSPTNPYISSNLFLSNEMERSYNLKNFVRTRGTPKAIRIVERPFDGSEVVLFYPEDNIIYTAERDPKLGSLEWMIKGPYPISVTDLKLMRHIMFERSETPVLRMEGRQVRYASRSSSSEMEYTDIVPRVPKIHPPAKPKEPKKIVTKSETKKEQIEAKPSEVNKTEKESKESKINKVEDEKTPTEEKPTIVEPRLPGMTAPSGKWVPLNTDQQAILMSLGYAERAQNGDIIHTVDFDDQNLAAIAKWYTGDSANASKIALANKIADDKPLTKGQRITVPLAIATNIQAMSSDFHLE